jgi:hypothetical protein
MTDTSLEEKTQEELEREAAFNRFINSEARGWWPWPGKAYRATFAHEAFNVLPREEDLVAFERLDFRRRQLVLVKLRRLESKISLKTLPTLIPFIAITAVIPSWGLRVIDPSSQPEQYMGLIYTSTLAILGMLVALGITGLFHTRSEAHHTAWMEALKDSHALKTKMDEEDRKADREAAATAEAASQLPEPEVVKAKEAAPTPSPVARAVQNAAASPPTPSASPTPISGMD